jgi:hypothetical protein
MPLLLPSAVFFLLFTFAPVFALPQELQFPSEETPQSQQKRLYSAAHPYLNDLVSELEKAIPDLHGLTPVSSQQDLPGLLDNVGNKTRDLLVQMPNLISREEIVQAVHTGTSTTNRSREFSYLILLSKTSGSVTMTEYRTDVQNHQIAPSGEAAEAPAAQGFALTWMYFHPTRRTESQFRYLGQQKVSRHKTYVVAFAQDPGMVKLPAEIRLRGKSFPMLYQGIAWVDASDFHIVRLRADLLAPQPEAHLQKLTMQVEFGEIRVSHVASRLWLPREATVEWLAGDSSSRGLLDLGPATAVSRGREQHSYSDYHVYEVEVKINPGSH